MRQPSAPEYFATSGRRTGSMEPRRAASAYAAATTRTPGAAARAASTIADRKTAESSQFRTPRRPIFRKSTPQAAAPAAASANVPGRFGASPSAALTDTRRPVAAARSRSATTARRTAGGQAPSDPSSGFLTSRTSAPPSSAAAASSTSETLVISSGDDRFGGI